MTTADRIKQIRTERDMTQTDLAKLCGYKDKSAICKIESSGDQISSKLISKIAKALNVSVVYLMGFEDEVVGKIKETSSYSSKLIMITGMLSEDSKEKLMSYAQFLLDSESTKNNKG